MNKLWSIKVCEKFFVLNDLELIILSNFFFFFFFFWKNGNEILSQEFHFKN